MSRTLKDFSGPIQAQRRREIAERARLRRAASSRNLRIGRMNELSGRRVPQANA
jgi:hypothetical protein